MAFLVIHLQPCGREFEPALAAANGTNEPLSQGLFLGRDYLDILQHCRPFTVVHRMSNKICAPLRLRLDEPWLDLELEQAQD